MINHLLQIQESLSGNAKDALWQVMEPVAALIATSLIILITFYLSNIKHDMLDEWLDEKHHRVKRRSPYARLMRFFFERRTFKVYF